MTNRDTQFDAYVLEIHKVLDQLDYYRLLGVTADDDRPAIKKMFYKIAAKFHPDRNRDASETVRDALYDIYKRLNEAYRVLGDAEQREMYDRALTMGKKRLELDDRRALKPKRPEETITSRSAQQFYRQAVAAMKEGQWLQAELHAQVALGHEKDSTAIQELIAQIKNAKKG